jgi:hypothetical protein
MVFTAPIFTKSHIQNFKQIYVYICVLKMQHKFVEYLNESINVIEAIFTKLRGLIHNFVQGTTTSNFMKI